ncbi:MAG: class IV adenylate cyclase [Planctomycetota bacterium]
MDTRAFVFSGTQLATHAGALRNEMQKLEVELKFVGAEPVRLEQQLIERGARLGGTMSQADEYFAHPQRNFAETDEALRVRSEGDRRVLTYKGPKLPGAVKIREEIEVDVGAGQESGLKRILDQLGFRSVAVVAKTRRSWQLTYAGWDLKVEIDDVQHLGSFVEIESVTDAQSVAATEAAILQLAQELGLGRASKASYLGLLLGAKREDRGNQT